MLDTEMLLVTLDGRDMGSSRRAVDEAIDEQSSGVD